ncbi:DnaD and phage-associated domain-containing protein [Alkalibacterium putridalgicola]|uniref:DnaD and phage-associated domain-containing protein n=1 Tax=Alkalibacterium putridalgicola TaxID=426703 RepID=A0A1H7RMJ4_9LACT|nr:DnaD domain protein [Alkalibacterium putridalgicola]GEK88906.1 hypothetical protein APU01nite_09450 [Alkalibacterium putridalgicola]SEL61413.1 DnaD and phage-associated domain-containing protein [Alkalibacterium putridalgicola]
MARPKKQTVDYFPHIANSGKTMFILESKFGNDGYAFWFKLLELLATTDGHVYDCRNSSHWQFLLAKTHQDDESAGKILDLLADLDAIDRELWNSQVVWCQHFVDNIADVYKNRKAKAPTRPTLNSFYDKKPEQSDVSTSKNEPEQELSAQPTNRKPQSKVKETKVNKTKVEEEHSDVNVHRFYQDNFGMANSHITQDIEMWCKDLSNEVVMLALKKAIEKNAPYSYAKAIMKSWANKDIKTVEAAEAESLSKSRQNNFSSQSTSRSESLPKWARDDYEPEKDEKVSPEEEAEYKAMIQRMREAKGANG